MRFLLIFLLLINYPLLSAQNSDKSFSYQIAGELAEGKLRSSSAAYKYIDIGDYLNALQLTEVALQWGVETWDLDGAEIEVVDGNTYFSDLDDSVQIVIISEAHHKPQHRIFTKSILKIFYDKGFRYLGLEALTPYPDNPYFLLDSMLNDRKYPLDSPLTGRYAMEPQMGNLIREALRMGFTIFGYEKWDKNVERDLQQAQNIKAIIDKDPEGKYLIHCGWYHAIESAEVKRRNDHYMAFHLKQMTGIDPLTIYQDIFSEKVLFRESPLYQKIESNITGILLDKAKPVKPVQHFDLNIFHPRTHFIDGRPSWLYNDYRNKPYHLILEDLDISFPAIIEARHYHESSDATPVDRLELLDRYQRKPLVLPSGNYTVTISDNKQAVFTLKIVVE